MKDILTELIGEVSASQTIKPDEALTTQEPSAGDEPQETLDQLMSDWRMKTNEPERAIRPVYDEHATPFLKKGELYDYWRNGTVTEPYIIVAIENLFGVPHELWEQMLEDIHAIGRIPGKTLAEDRLQREIDFFNRVLATASITKDVNPQFVADYTRAQHNRLHELACLRYAQEKREHAEEERSRNDFYKKNRFRR